MLKKLVIASAVLMTSSTVAMASGSPYIGAGLGLNDTLFKVNDSNTSTTAVNNTHNIGARGALLNVFGGYGATLNQNIYLGGEAFINAANTQAKDTVISKNGSTNLTFKNKYSYGVSVIPGIKITDHTMAYARAGIVRTRFETAQTAGLTNKTDRNTVTGGQLGLGLQTSLTQNVDLRGEYVYTNYRKFNTTMVNNIQPSSDQFMLGLVYKID